VNSIYLTSPLAWGYHLDIKPAAAMLLEQISKIKITVRNTRGSGIWTTSFAQPVNKRKRHERHISRTHFILPV